MRSFTPLVTEQLLTSEQVAGQLQVPVETLRKWRYHRSGPTFLKIGRHVRYKQIDVDRFVARSKVA